MALVGNTPAELKTFVDSEIDRWAKVMKEGNLEVD